MLQYITNTSCPTPVVDQVAAVLKGGCRWVQLRMKDATDDEKKQAAEHETKAESLRNEENADIKTYADTVPAIRQIIDIALLGNNLLRGEDLDKFLRRSIDLLK